jgi:hypothetical protein
VKRIADWIDRIRTIEGRPGEFVFRAVMPSHDFYTLADTLIKIEPLGPLPGRPGDSEPTSGALLRFLDTRPLSHDSILLATDLGSLISFAAGRYFEVAAEIRLSVEGRPESYFLGLGATIDRKLRGPMPTETRSRLMECLARIPALSQNDLAALGAAIKLHHGSVVLCHRDFRAAYLLLVAALEVLSREYGTPPHDWSAWQESISWDSMFADLQLSDSQRKAIRGRLLESQSLRLKATFREYVSQTIPDQFWEEPWQEWHYVLNATPPGSWGPPELSETPVEALVPKDRTVLSNALGRSYDLRSGLIHRGDELHLLEVGLRPGIPLSGSDPVPYAVLRAFLSSLISKELWSRAEPVSLPDLRFL